MFQSPYILKISEVVGRILRCIGIDGYVLAYSVSGRH